MAGALFADHVKDLNKEEYRALLEDIKCIKRWDISPELEGAMDFAQYVKSKGIMLAVTHTEAEYDLPMKLVLPMRHISIMQCPASINVVNINMKEP